MLTKLIQTTVKFGRFRIASVSILEPADVLERILASDQPLHDIMDDVVGCGLKDSLLQKLASEKKLEEKIFQELAEAEIRKLERARREFVAAKES